MLLFNVRSNNQGFTLIEMLAVIMIVGILSAIAAPGLLGMLNRNKVNSALDQVQGSLREAQREAMRKGKRCTVYIVTPSTLTDTDPASKTLLVPNGISNGCLVTGDRTLPSEVKLATNLTPSQVTFSLRGNTTYSGTIVVYSDDSNQQKKCLFISTGLGIMKTGNYSGSTSSINNTNCTKPQ